MNREELYEEYSNQYPLIMGFREVTYEDWLQKQVIDLRTNKPLPPAEGAETILHRHIDKQSMDELSVNVWPDILEAMQEFAAQQQPTAEGAEEILLSHPYLKVMYDDTAGEVCMVEQAIWAIEKFATIHAQRIADKMVSEEKWINVKDGLPEKDGKSSIYCLVNSKYDGIVVRPYNEYHKCWDTEDADDYYCDAIGGKITHWMPLPNHPIE